ncbi:MAG: hypothetical protein N3B14_09300 [Thermoleophilia bacterium]|nr:hypothetical protein [Thermoleophilia bacterium]
MSAHNRRLAVVLVSTFLLLGTAMLSTSCGAGLGGQDGEDTTTAPPIETSSTSSTLPPISHPTDPTQLVMRISLSEGFVPVQVRLTRVPTFSLYGDGTVIVTGPIVLIYPGPALPNLQAAQISEEIVQAILREAQRVGLFANDVDYGRPNITDLANTVIDINAGGSRYQSSIYALGMEEGASGLTKEQQRARAAVDDFVAKLSDLSAFTAEPIVWSPYEFTALRVYAAPFDPEAWADAEVQPDLLDWPLNDPGVLGKPTDDPQGFREFALQGEDLAKLRPLLSQATQITVWQWKDKQYNLYFRPLLPDESPNP